MFIKVRKKWYKLLEENFEAGDKWYEQEPESALENEDYKILWDFSIQTGHVIEARRPDFVVVDKKLQNNWFCSSWR